MLTYFLFSILLFSCSIDSSIQPTKETTKPDPMKIKYWYGGEAEISSYQLTQARYGELRAGKAVMVFVTEPFSPKTNTKSDHQKKDDISVLKLNFTKNFKTGIYPYSMMTSSFFPFDKGKHSLKISSSSQEWCGHTFMEMRNHPRKSKFQFKINSYFEGESKEGINTDKALMEDDLWTMIRLTPEKLPQGKQKMYPAFFYLRMAHIELKAYSCELSTSTIDENTNSYTINFPELDRSTTIKYSSDFPHKILSWEETYYDGYGSKRKKLTTKGTLIKTIKSVYWTKNSNADADLRKELGL